MKLRKKLSMTIASLIITPLVAYLGTKGIDMDSETQASFIIALTFIIGAIVGTFNIGQGIADKGKEAGKMCLAWIMSFVLLGTIFITPAMAQDPVSNLQKCETQLADCNQNNADCDDILTGTQEQLEDCEKACDNCTWRSMILDKKVQTAIISAMLAVIGGAVTLLAAGGN